MAKKTIFLKFFGKEALLGGLNTTDNPIIVPPNQMTIANNVAIARTLARKKRGGLVRYNTGSFPGTASFPEIANPATAASAIRGIIQYWRYGSATGEPAEDVFLHQDDKVWSIPDQINAATDVTGALVLDPDAIPSYQVFEGILYWTDSLASGYYKWNALGIIPGNADNANPPDDGAGKYLRAHQGRMWMAGNPSFPFRLYWSSALDAEDWSSGGGSTGGSLDLSYDGDPDGITAIFPPFQGRLYVATRRRIYEVRGATPEDFVVMPITQGIGCISHNAVSATPNDVIFCSDRGVHSLQRVEVSDQSDVTFLSRDIQSIWVSLLNRSLLVRTQSVFDENTNTYLVTCVGSGQQQNKTTLVFNIEFGTWTVWQDIDARSVCQVLINNQSYILTGRENGEVAYIDENMSFDLQETNGFPMQFRTGKIYPGDQIDTQFRVHSVTIIASTTRISNINVAWNLDSLDSTKSGNKSISMGQDTDVLGSTFIMGQSQLGFGQFIAKKITVDNVGYNFQLSIGVSGLSDIEFYGFILEVSNEDSHYV